MSPKDTVFSKKSTIRCGNKIISIDKPLVMGILNITPDSFFEGSRALGDEKIIKRCSHLIEEGAKIIDVGAESTRPGAKKVPEKEELNRLIPAISSIRKNFPEILISVDTYKSETARRAIDAGADIINDISGGSLDDDMFQTIADLKVPYILMHTKGTPETMMKIADYEDVVKEIIKYFSEKLKKLYSLGVADIILDPGFGFAKTTKQNYQLLNRLQDFKIFELPLLCGVSRKRMINEILNIKAADALNGTTVINTIALQKGADILRVHDVKQAVETIKIVETLNDL